MKISVCLATYNGEKFLKEQLDSILNQLESDDELIISDDGSKDKTLEIIRAYKDQRIRIFRNMNKHGVVFNFENAIQKSSGNIILLCDQDDVWFPNKVKVLTKELEEFDFVVHNALLVDENGKSLNQDFFSFRKTRYGYWANLWKMGYPGCCMAFKKECIKDILPFPPNLLWHDIWIAAILHAKYKGTLIKDCLIGFRRHSSNTSPTTQKSHYSFYFRFKYRVYVLFYSILRLLHLK